MTAVAVVCFPIFLTGYKVQRWEGGLFLVYYAAYTAVIVMVAKNTSLESRYVDFIRYGVVPLTMVTFVASLLISRRERHKQEPAQ